MFSKIRISGQDVEEKPTEDVFGPSYLGITGWLPHFASMMIPKLMEPLLQLNTGLSTFGPDGTTENLRCMLKSSTERSTFGHHGTEEKRQDQMKCMLNLNTGLSTFGLDGTAENLRCMLKSSTERSTFGHHVTEEKRQDQMKCMLNNEIDQGLSKQHNQPTNAPILEKTTRVLNKTIIILVCCLTFCGASSVPESPIECPTRQIAALGVSGIVRCVYVFGEFSSVYWSNTTNEEDTTVLIQMENGRIAGIGYTTGEFNLQSDGSLIINKVSIQHEGIFRVEILNTNFMKTTYDISLTVYVEPTDPVPMISECPNQSACIIKGDQSMIISCVHENTRPAAEVSWFMRLGRKEVLLNSTTTQTFSDESFSFTTSSELSVTALPIDTDIHPLVLLVCKSSQPISIVQGSESKVMIDFYDDDPFAKQEDQYPVYALENEYDFIIECQSHIDTTNTVLVWMYRSLYTQHNEYLMVSAYSDVMSTFEADTQYNFTENGAIVINHVGLQHEGFYACLTNTDNTTQSFLQRIEIIVPPKPPTVLVAGCELFHPCHSVVRETAMITCNVNGVHPQVDLRIRTQSTNVFLTKTDTEIRRENGLFYIQIQGEIKVNKAICGENETVVCQAFGAAANAFKSEVYITIIVDEQNCQLTSTDVVNPEVKQEVYWSNMQMGVLYISPSCIVIGGVIIIIIIIIKQHRRRYDRNLEYRPTPRSS